MVCAPLITFIVAQCSATPASVAATPPCSATPCQRQLNVRHPWQLKGDRCDRAFQGVCCDAAATPEKPQDSEEVCCDNTCSATGGSRTRVQLWLPLIPYFRGLFSFFSQQIAGVCSSCVKDKGRKSKAREEKQWENSLQPHLHEFL